MWTKFKYTLMKYPSLYKLGSSVWSKLPFKKKNLETFQSAQKLRKDLNLSSIRFTEEGAFVKDKDGFEWLVDLDNNSLSRVFVWVGYFEPAETAYLKKKIKKDWTVIDIGANFGWFSARFSKWAKQVYAFEPAQNVYRQLNRNLDLNSCENVVAEKLALGEQKGQLDLYSSTALGDGGSSLANLGGDAKKETVDIVTLDSYVQSNNLKKVDFIKADIEGAELMMLKGAEKTLKEMKPDLMLEIVADNTKRFGYAPEDILKLLESWGYSAEQIGECNYYLTSKN